ncbi:MAG: hypothetical protein HYV63_02510 [Candidatus Schekmanbacteria bacterium]|nr:hypothetical protein [Candidatus Schekmanbacteria bacterium]
MAIEKTQSSVSARTTQPAEEPAVQPATGGEPPAVADTGAPARDDYSGNEATQAAGGQEWVELSRAFGGMSAADRRSYLQKLGHGGGEPWNSGNESDRNQVVGLKRFMAKSFVAAANARFESKKGIIDWANGIAHALSAVTRDVPGGSGAPWARTLASSIASLPSIWPTGTSTPGMRSATMIRFSSAP